MDIEKSDIEWLIMFLVTHWPKIEKLFKALKKALVQRHRSKRKR